MRLLRWIQAALFLLSKITTVLVLWPGKFEEKNEMKSLVCHDGAACLQSLISHSRDYKAPPRKVCWRMAGTNQIPTSAARACWFVQVISCAQDDRTKWDFIDMCVVLEVKSNWIRSIETFRSSLQAVVDLLMCRRV